MAETMIILSKEEINSKVKKLEKTVLDIFAEFGATPQGGAALELSFIVNMDDANLKKAVKAITPFAEKQGFKVEVMKE